VLLVPLSVCIAGGSWMGSQADTGTFISVSSMPWSKLLSQRRGLNSVGQTKGDRNCTMTHKQSCPDTRPLFFCG